MDKNMQTTLLNNYQSSYELVTSLNCCFECDFNYAPFGANDRSNSVIFVGDVVGMTELNFFIDVRGVPNKPETTSELAIKFLDEFANKFFELFYTDETGKDLKISFLTEINDENIDYNQIDDYNRSSILINATIKNIKTTEVTNGQP